MRSKYSIPKLSKKAVLFLKEVHQDRNKMISYKISGGIASLMTGEKNLIPDSSKRTPESWEMALEELISTKLIVNIEIPDVYKITAKGYQLVDMLNNHVNDHTQNINDNSDLLLRMKKRGYQKKSSFHIEERIAQM